MQIETTAAQLKEVQDLAEIGIPLPSIAFVLEVPKPQIEVFCQTEAVQLAYQEGVTAQHKLLREKLGHHAAKGDQLATLWLEKFYKD